MTDEAVLAIDQGTGSTKGLLVELGPMKVSPLAGLPLRQARPHPGWVEQDANEIATSALALLHAALAKQPGLRTIGLSTQRESAVAWERSTGQILGPMLGWQDRRTLPAVAGLREAGAAIREISGLPLDPMFSALKFAWLLDQIDPDRRQSRAGKLVLGTVDAWLMRTLTGHDQIEIGNASRTQLLDVRTGVWSPELLSLFNIPIEALPQVVPSDQQTPVLPEVAGSRGVRVSAVLGDSHAALFGHGVRAPGEVKVTYGTGSSVMGLSSRPIPADSGVVETLGWQRQGTVARAFEGNILSTGHTLVWLGELLGCTAEQVAELAEQATPKHEINLIPAFAGLGAPWWREDAVAVLCGFDLGTDRAALCRAAAESIPLQVEDVLTRADQVTGSRVALIRADGGPSGNNWLMQLQADLGGRAVARPAQAAMSALGAAQFAAMAAGLADEAALTPLRGAHTSFHPRPEHAEWATARRANWTADLRRAMPA